MTNYIEKFSNLRVNTVGKFISPHKPCLLLAVIDLAEAGGLVENQVFYRPELTDRFNDYFEVVRRDHDRPNIYMPFFHLKGDGFWHPQALDGRAAVLEAMNTAVKHRDITENIKAIQLDSELHMILQNDESRQQLRAVLISSWFGDRAERVWSVVNQHKPDNEAEAALRNNVEAAINKVEDAETPARCAAFRRIVLQAYDYRCAATGWRIIMPGGSSLVEAAHIVPFSETYNDDPRNGMALMPTFHAALDRNLIAPGPDMKWRVSPLFDKRIPDNRLFLELAGKDVMYSGNHKYRPSESYLEIRASMLLQD